MTQLLKERMRSVLEERRKKGSLRHLRIPEAQLCDFSSNDYLGLSRSIAFRQFVEIQSKPYPVSGATGSRLLSGHSRAVDDLEVQAARFHKAEAGLVFNSGYDANLSVLSCLPCSDDAIVYDDLVHASVHDGMRMSRARERLFPFRHNDLASFRETAISASKACSGTILVCVETVYSMEGDVAPVKKLLELAAALERQLHREVYMIADEAHAGGLYGENGEGFVCAASMERHRNLLVRVVTFGKAFGAHGAVVLGSNLLRQYLINYARPFIYSTALPPHSIFLLSVAYKFMETAQARTARKRLWTLVRYFHSMTQKTLPKGAIMPHSNLSPIQAICVPGNRECVQLANVLRVRGFEVYPIRSPTVPKGTERIRVIIHADNTEDEIRRLLQATCHALEGVVPRSKL